MPDLIQDARGIWWPADDEWGREIIPLEIGPAMSWLHAHNKRWGTIIQAGGNVGLYPEALGHTFGHVMTFEPDPVNYECIRRNVGAQNVIWWQGALGERMGACGMVEVMTHNCGAHRIEPDEDGGIPLFTIDGMEMTPDVIWLDVEGSELPALKGAAETLKRCKPMVIVELKGLGEAYGYTNDDVHAYLEDFGYKLVSEHGNDRMFA